MAIVDNPATNSGFFTCLSIGDEEMADTANANVAELTAERDLLAGEVARLKGEVTKLSADLTAKGAELSVAKSEATIAATNAERSRVADVIALCSKAGKVDLSAKHITDGTAVVELQRALFDVLCAANKPIGDGGSAADLSAQPDENASYKAEYKANTYLSARMTVEDYIASRRIDDGRDPLQKLKAA